ncbi:MAG TPA: NAD(P)/FAD-dependent oxidoreductase [Bacillota bacterium]|nr:NAD(P)/FAD-dependent oxidoreductase [Bacillota bacterium]
MTNHIDVVIVGGGPAGISAAIWCKRLGLNHLLIESSHELGGQLQEIHNKIIDYPGFIANNGAFLKEKFAEQIKHLDCLYEIGAQVNSIAVEQSILNYSILDSSPQIIHFHSLILATGSSSKRLGIPGEAQMIARGEIYSASKDSAYFTNGKPVAVIGGGDRAFEGAWLLAEHGAQVFLIHHSGQFRARSELCKQVLNHPQITLHTHAQVTKICGKNKVEGIKIVRNEGHEQFLAVEAVFVRIGVEPNSHLIREQVKTDSEGYIIVNGFGQTSIPNIYAVGDVCTRPTYSSIATGVGQAMIAAKQISLSLNSH